MFKNLKHNINSRIKKMITITITNRDKVKEALQWDLIKNKSNKMINLWIACFCNNKLAKHIKTIKEKVINSHLKIQIYGNKIMIIHLMSYNLIITTI